MGGAGVTPRVNVIGYHDARTGLGEIARLVSRSLDTAGIEHAVVQVEEGVRPPWRPPPAAPHPVNLVCVNAEMLPRAVQMLGRDVFDGRRTIGFWWWEVERFPGHLRWAAQILDEIWVGSEHVRRAVAPVAGRPVHVFPVPVPVPQAAAGLSRGELGLPEGFLFLFAFNYASVFERKNPLGLVEAFSRAFAPGEASLAIKTTGSALFAREQSALQAAAASRRDIVVIDRELDPARYHSLTQSADAYASLHRAEGFGLTIAEAMALGKPSVATAYSGNLEFMTAENSYLVDYDLVPVPPGTPYPLGSRWAEPDVDDAARQLRAVFDDTAEAARRGACAAAELASTRTFAAAGEFVLSRLLDDGARDGHDGPLEIAAARALGGVDLTSTRRWLVLARRLAQPLFRPYSEHDAEVAQLILDAVHAGQERLEDRLRRIEERLDALEAREQ